MASNPPTKPLFGVPRLHNPDQASDDILQSKPSSSHDNQASVKTSLSLKIESTKPPQATSIDCADRKPSTAVRTPGKAQTMKSRRGRGSLKIRKLKDPLAPRRPPSSFLMFCSEARPNVVKELGGNALGPVAIELGKRWAEIDKEAKMLWEVRGKEAMVRFEEEKLKYRPSEDFLLAAAAHDQKQLGKQCKGDPAKIVDKMAPYFTHLLTNWIKVATTRPELTAQEVQEMVWQQWSKQASNGLGGKRRGKKKVKDPNAPKHPMSAYLIYLNNMRVELVKEKPMMPNKEVMVEVGKMWKGLDEESKASYVKEAKEKSEVYYQEMAKYKGYY